MLHMMKQRSITSTGIDQWTLVTSNPRTNQVKVSTPLTRTADSGRELRFSQASAAMSTCPREVADRNRNAEIEGDRGGESTC